MHHANDINNSSNGNRTWWVVTHHMCISDSHSRLCSAKNPRTKKAYQHNWMNHSETVGIQHRMTVKNVTHERVSLKPHIYHIQISPLTNIKRRIGNTTWTNKIRRNIRSHSHYWHRALRGTHHHIQRSWTPLAFHSKDIPSYTTNRRRWTK